MKSQVLKCQNCGSPFYISKVKKSYRCDYCNATTVFETEIEEDILDFNNLIIKTEDLEGYGDYHKTVVMYDEYLEIDPDNPYILFARAFASMSDTNEDYINFDLFKEYFDKGLAFIEEDKINILDFIMYRYRRLAYSANWLWTNSDYLNTYDFSKTLAKRKWKDNLLILNDIQNIINELVDNNLDYENLTKSFIEEYKDFKISTVKRAKELLEYRYSYGISLERKKKKEIKKSIKDARKKYSIFTKTIAKIEK